jgi:hypothetical protein
MTILRIVMVFVHCTSSYCAWPLYEVAFNSNHLFSSNSFDKKKSWRAITLWLVKMELWFLCTALPLNVLDHCMKLYWNPTFSFQVKLQTRKMQRTAGQTDRTTDHWVTPPPPPTSFWGYYYQKHNYFYKAWKHKNV